MKRKKETQRVVYKRLMDTLEQQGFNKFNTCVLTLQLPINCLIKDKPFMNRINKLMKPLSVDYIAVIEPVLETDGKNTFRPNYYKTRYYQNLNKILPMYHAHVIVKMTPEEMMKHKATWLKLCRSKQGCLFHCEPIKKTTSQLVNYVTKFYEDKRDFTPIHFIHVQELEMIQQVLDLSISTPDLKVDGHSQIKTTWLTKLITLPRRIVKSYFDLLQKMSDETFKVLIDE